MVGGTVSRRWVSFGICWLGLLAGSLWGADRASNFEAEFKSVGAALRKAPLPEYPGVLDRRLRPLLRQLRASLVEGGPGTEATMRAALLGTRELLAVEDVEAAMLTAYAVSADPELVVRVLRTLSETDREELAFYLFAGTSSCGEGDPRKPSLLRLEIAMAPLLDELIVKADEEAAAEANASGSHPRK
ncbi:hypothetical protein MAMC_01779 [Methylacidimicrobium cyclopophantes]|uniref:Uncharacterized protein n=1 Tax=Methylacidimicrobium cyclopophantes TaxID=1041766 RepID=A0A5E6MFB1_9BACT|nr:hypothetical protein [Methylacidimicrobium cyclopophantes]VVM07677.1 hypothetical protein MAMC_01779 [Methylacidimicrobium cyclopophantes]